MRNGIWSPGRHALAVRVVDVDEVLRCFLVSLDLMS